MPFSLCAASGALLAFATICLPHAALAQSAGDDSDLFPQDEQILRFGTSDRNITIAPFIQLDGGYVSPEPSGGSGFSEELRLARLYLYGAYDQFGGTLAFDLENDDFPIRYAFVTYEPNDRLTYQFGQQDEPFSLQDLSGSRFLPFAEAGQSATLGTGDNVGAQIRYGGDDHSLALGVFGGDLNNSVRDNGIAVTGRATWAPIYRESEITRGGDAADDGVGTQRVDDLLHLGAAISVRGDIDRSFSFGGNANSSLTSRTLAASPTFDGADTLVRANLEAARSIGSLSFQGELTGIHVDAPGLSGFGHGGYLYTTYFVTGERRGYDRQAGTFGRVVPINPIDEGGFGAFEIGARADYLDLSDLGPEGGTQFGLSAVANLYLTKRFTLTADYSYTQATSGPNDGDRVHAVTGRFQFAY